MDRGIKAVIAGGIALAVSPFLPWVKVILLGNLSLFQLFEAAGHSAGVAWAAVIAGGATGLTAYRARRVSTVRLTGVIVGVLGGLLAVYALIGLREELNDAQGLATVAVGPYVAVAGCVAMAVGGWVAKAPRVAGSGR